MTLVQQGVREHRGLLWVGPGLIALGLYRFLATQQADVNVGRILTAYGGVVVAGSLAWGTVVEGIRPHRYNVIGAAVHLAGVAVIMYAPGGVPLFVAERELDPETAPSAAGEAASAAGEGLTRPSAVGRFGIVDDEFAAQPDWLPRARLPSPV